MVKREIVVIDEEKCNGCGLCIPNCPEGALQIIDGKARLVSDLFCDGLGACVGHCPQDAIKIEEREAETYDERKVMENIVKCGDNTIKAHLKHLKDHGEDDYYNTALDYLKEKGIKIPKEDSKNLLPCGCPGSSVMDLRDKKTTSGTNIELDSELRQWPVQLMLVPPNAPYFDNANLLISADCVPFAYANFHQDFLRGKVLIVGCPKLDDIEFYKEKLTAIIKSNNIKSITLVNMVVPCCFGLQHAIEEAIKDSGKTIPLKQSIISIDGRKN